MCRRAAHFTSVARSLSRAAAPKHRRCVRWRTDDTSPAILRHEREDAPMMRYLAGRLLRALLTIFLVVTFAFFVLRLSGDPALLIMSVDAPPESIEAFRKSWGLDQPIWMQYLAYVGHALTGDL